jgi:hypothetical protein
MATTTLPSGTFVMAEDLTVTRVGYGAMQPTGPGVFLGLRLFVPCRGRDLEPMLMELTAQRHARSDDRGLTNPLSPQSLRMTSALANDLLPRAGG